MSLIKCPECGKELESGILSCPECGCPLSKEETNPTTDVQATKALRRKIIALIMCLVACFCLYNSFSTINDDSYKFYKEHYADCMQGYGETSAMSDGYSYGYFKSSYQSIANSYLDMADDDMKEIWKYRIKAIAYGASGGLLLTGAILFYRKKEA